MLWLLLFLMTISRDVWSEPGQPQYTRTAWRVQDGLPEDTVQALAETKDGYLRVGTTGGLTRFDGTEFSIYRTTTLLVSGVNSIFCLAPSRDGGLWSGQREVVYCIC